MIGHRTRLAAVLTALGIIGFATGPSAVGLNPQQRGVGGLVQYHSRDGALSVTLRAEQGKVRIGDLVVDGATFNGLYAGPVLRALPGDLLSIRLVNRLPEATNLHFHGMRASPLGYSDNVHLSIPANTTFTYQLRIPVTQPPGLYWYHVHPHGTSRQQVEGGLTGTIVVETPAPPPVAERLFVLKDMAFDDDTGDATIDNELHGIVQSINGALDTNMSARPNQTQLWRFSNQSADRMFHLALEGHRFHVLAEDAEPVINERWEDVLDIPPAKRFEVLVEAGEPGRYALISKGAMTGTGADRRPDRVMGHLAVSGEPVAPVAIAPLPPPPDLRDAAISATHVVAFSQNKTLKEKDQHFYINGKLFDIDRIDVRVPLGSVEEWTVRNESDDMHVFHIHQIGFQVTAVNGAPVPFTGYVDTVRVPEHGTVTLRMPFLDPLILGRFMFHCHVLKHEDKGMMGQIEVYDPASRPVTSRLGRLSMHIWWWLHGVPWGLCGLSDA